MRAHAAQVLEQAERDDDAFEFERALPEYEAALRLDPSMARAMRAEQRAKTLRARSEGNFAPLRALERIRRSPELGSSAAAIDALVRDAEAFPPGLVRVEVWVLAAEAYASRLDRPNDAVPLWHRIIDDPASDPVVARAAMKSLTTYHLARHEFDQAERATRSPVADAKLIGDVHRAIRRHRLHIASIFVIGLALLCTGIALFRATRAGQLTRILAGTRKWSALMLGYAAYVALGGALLASGYEEGSARPFLFFGATLFPILFIARTWNVAGSSARAPRAFRALLCATSTLGAAFLVLESLDVTYLEGLGL